LGRFCGEVRFGVVGRIGSLERRIEHSRSHSIFVEGGRGECFEIIAKGENKAECLH
jgi:hypothetical protein